MREMRITPEVAHQRFIRRCAIRRRQWTQSGGRRNRRGTVPPPTLVFGRTDITCRAVMLVAILGVDITISIRAGNRRHTLGSMEHSVGAVLLAPSTRFVALAPETEPTNARRHAIMSVAWLCLCFICGVLAFLPSVLSVGVHQKPRCLLTATTLLGAMRPG